MAKYMVTCSSGISLNFPTKQEYDSYNEEMHRLQLETYIYLRAKYGIWASNQDKYVTSTSDLTWLDNTYMEEQLALALSKGSL